MALRIARKARIIIYLVMIFAFAFSVFLSYKIGINRGLEQTKIINSFNVSSEGVFIGFTNDISTFIETNATQIIIAYNGGYAIDYIKVTSTQGLLRVNNNGALCKEVRIAASRRYLDAIIYSLPENFDIAQSSLTFDELLFEFCSESVIIYSETVNPILKLNHSKPPTQIKPA